MRAFILLLGWIAAIAVAGAAEADKKRSAAEERWRRFMEGPHVRRGIPPLIKLQRSRIASAEEATRIKSHIANLAKIDRPDFGISGTMSGRAFAPIAETRSTSMGLLTDHQLKTSDDFRQLVALGSRALPFLLEALDDKTPTKLTPKHHGGVGAMFLATEMGSNPTNTLEQNVIASLPKRDVGFGPDSRVITDYSIKVGDVCFVIIGQIVGRDYLAVRYQPTAIIVVNSPTEEKALAKAVRDIWSSTNVAQRLFESLLFDYSTEGVFNGESLDGWDMAGHLQCQAVLRMLYYFPRETSGVIANRLAHLDVGGRTEGVIDSMHREVSNGVRALDFIKAVAWSDDEAIRRELLNIAKRTTDTGILLAALSGTGTNETNVAGRLIEMIAQLPDDEDGPFGRGYHLLLAYGEKFGLDAKPTFIRYLTNASVQRWRTMARLLRETRKEWAAELLSPALADKRETGWSYSLVAGKNEPRRPMRICDEVAETIGLSRPDLHFNMEGEHENLDRQITSMRARIASSTNPAP